MLCQSLVQHYALHVSKITNLPLLQSGHHVSTPHGSSPHVRRPLRRDLLGWPGGAHEAIDAAREPGISATDLLQNLLRDRSVQSRDDIATLQACHREPQLHRRAPGHARGRLALLAADGDVALVAEAGLDGLERPLNGRLQPGGSGNARGDLGVLEHAGRLWYAQQCAELQQVPDGEHEDVHGAEVRLHHDPQVLEGAQGRPVVQVQRHQQALPLRRGLIAGLGGLAPQLPRDAEGAPPSLVRARTNQRCNASQVQHMQRRR
mmetsp:Transcript_88693/g.225812  ORF Transcript_88693/g.225812 Transcript_88693/m.225812 type:complete len:262 (-) Transcript_88693:177-962(-)